MELNTRNEIMVLIAYAQKPPISARTDVSGELDIQLLVLSLHLHPCFEYASATNALASLYICTDSHEPSLLDDNQMFGLVT